MDLFVIVYAIKHNHATRVDNLVNGKTLVEGISAFFLVFNFLLFKGIGKFCIQVPCYCRSLSFFNLGRFFWLIFGFFFRFSIRLFAFIFFFIYLYLFFSILFFIYLFVFFSLSIFFLFLIYSFIPRFFYPRLLS